MQKKLFRTGTAGTIFICILLGAMAAFFAVLLAGILSISFYGADIADADSYGDYVYLDASYLSGSFASDDEGNEYIFATMQEDEKWYDYIVGMPASVYKSEDIQKLVRSDEAPDSPFRLRGTLMETTDELDQLAQEAYSSYMDLTEEEDAADYLGRVCLMYEPSGNNLSRVGGGIWVAIIFMAAVIILWIVELILQIRRQRRKNRKITKAKRLYETDPDYQNGVRQIEEPDTQYFKSCKCYITRDYVVSFQDGLEVFRLDKISELYGYDKHQYRPGLAVLFGALASLSSDHCLVALTLDGEVHMFARLAAALKPHNKIVAAILQKNRAVLLGRENIPAQSVQEPLEQLNLARIKGFYGGTDVWSGRSLKNFSIE